MANIIRTLSAHRDLIWNLVARDLKIRYRGSVLGFLWTILTPLFMALIYVFFLRLLARGMPIRNEEIIIGVFAWQFTMQCVNAGIHCITGNTVLVKKVYFPRIILPITVGIANLVNFLLTVVVQWGLLAVMLHYQGSHLSAWSPLVLLVSIYHLFFNLALAMILGATNVYFRDTQHIVNLLVNAWFFMSPVMYPPSLVEQFAHSHGVPWVNDLYLMNPMAGIITAYRALQMPDVAFPWSAAMIAGLAWPILFFALAYIMFQRMQRDFSDVL